MPFTGAWWLNDILLKTGMYVYLRRWRQVAGMHQHGVLNALCIAL